MTTHYFDPNIPGDLKPEQSSQQEKKEDDLSLNLDDREEEDIDDNLESEDDDNDIDSEDDYGSSGEKYGWYNGFSDDVIDDAFDGDPEATWNVD